MNQVEVIDDKKKEFEKEVMMLDKNITEIPKKIRIKFLIDGAKGISYLHSNGILHRDIKPDDFLVVTLDDNIKVNCTLTDFGGSRNINMMIMLIERKE
ncbi:hypothetical protein ENUP19_0163G0027 [Entamoeba nuttalli]|uniref:Protein kinase domain-containing protein n=1 Tax=Entamoeba nuttalli TaxID=412467 RepID=A0ABQ0DLY8_9EUKA